MVSVTIMPQKFFAEQIAQDKWVVNCIVPSGSNPEAFDPSPAHLVQLGQSKAYFKVGQLGFERAWLGKIEQNNPHIKIYDISQGVSMLVSSHSHSHGNEIHEETVVDPHIWSSPKNAYIMARNMYEAFVALDPEGADYYKANYDNLLRIIADVDSVVTHSLANVTHKAFAIYHPSLSYLARDYGLVQICLENEGKEASALQLRQIVDKAREEGVETVFIQKEFNERQVATFANELNAKIIVINPLNYDWVTEIKNIAYALSAN